MKELMKYEFRRRKTSRMISIGTAAVGLFLMLSGLLFWKATVAASGFLLLFIGTLIAPFYAGVESILLLNRDLQNGQGCMLWMVPRSVLQIFGAKYLSAGLQTIFSFCLFFLLLILGAAACVWREKGFAALADTAAAVLPTLGISWIDLVQDAATAILLWLQIVMSGFFAVLLARTVLADSRHGGLLSFLLFWLINLACGLGVSGGQRPFPPVRTSACGLVCLRRDLLPGPRSSLLPADRFSRGQEAESAGCLIGHIPILYMELTQTWQNPPFRFATMKKSRSAACKCFRPETHSETEGTIHGRKQRPHPSVPDPVRAAGSFFRRRLGCLHWTDAVSLKIFEIHRSGRFSAQNRPDIFR